MIKVSMTREEWLMIVSCYHGRKISGKDSIRLRDLYRAIHLSLLANQMTVQLNIIAFWDLVSLIGDDMSDGPLWRTKWQWIWQLLVDGYNSEIIMTDRIYRVVQIPHVEVALYYSQWVKILDCLPGWDNTLGEAIRQALNKDQSMLTPTGLIKKVYRNDKLIIQLNPMWLHPLGDMMHNIACRKGSGPEWARFRDQIRPLAFSFAREWVTS